MNSGNHVRLYRKAAGLSQTALSQISGVSQSSVSNIERGDYPGGARVRVRIALALNIPVERVLPDEAPLTHWAVRQPSGMVAAAA